MCRPLGFLFVTVCGIFGCEQKSRNSARFPATSQLEDFLKFSDEQSNILADFTRLPQLYGAKADKPEVSSEDVISLSPPIFIRPSGCQDGFALIWSLLHVNEADWLRQKLILESQMFTLGETGETYNLGHLISLESGLRRNLSGVVPENIPDEAKVDGHWQMETLGDELVTQTQITDETSEKILQYHRRDTYNRALQTLIHQSDFSYERLSLPASEDLTIGGTLQRRSQIIGGTKPYLLMSWMRDVASTQTSTRFEFLARIKILEDSGNLEVYGLGRRSYNGEEDHYGMHFEITRSKGDCLIQNQIFRKCSVGDGTSSSNNLLCDDVVDGLGYSEQAFLWPSTL